MVTDNKILPSLPMPLEKSFAEWKVHPQLPLKRNRFYQLNDIRKTSIERNFVRFSYFHNKKESYKENKPEWLRTTRETGNFSKISIMHNNQFQPSAAFHIEPIQLITTVYWMTGFCMKCNTWLKWINLFNRRLLKAAVCNS